MPILFYTPVPGSVVRLPIIDQEVDHLNDQGGNTGNDQYDGFGDHHGSIKKIIANKFHTRTRAPNPYVGLIPFFTIGGLNQ